IDGVDETETPLPNVIVDHIVQGGGLSQGVAYWIGNAMVQTGKTPQEIAEAVGKGELDLIKLSAGERSAIAAAINEIAVKTADRIRENRRTRENYIDTLGEGKKPYLYVIVATGNIFEDVIQAQSAVR